MSYPMTWLRATLVLGLSTVALATGASAEDPFRSFGFRRLDLPQLRTA